MFLHVVFSASAYMCVHVRAYVCMCVCMCVHLLRGISISIRLDLLLDGDAATTEMAAHYMLGTRAIIYIRTGCVRTESAKVGKYPVYFHITQCYLTTILAGVNSFKTAFHGYISYFFSNIIF